MVAGALAEDYRLCISKNAPSLQGIGHADVARSRLCSVSLTYQEICYVLYFAMRQCPANGYTPAPVTAIT